MNRFQNNLRFALRKENTHIREEIPLNRAEQIGTWLSWLVYEFWSLFGKVAIDPRFITICLTTVAMTLSALVFYPLTTLEIVTDTSIWFLRHINWSYIRFSLWILSEITIFGLGMRAFGRFSNRKLMVYHGIVS